MECVLGVASIVAELRVSRPMGLYIVHVRPARSLADSSIANAGLIKVGKLLSIARWVRRWRLGSG